MFMDPLLQKIQTLTMAKVEKSKENVPYCYGLKIDDNEQCSEQECLFSASCGKVKSIIYSGKRKDIMDVVLNRFKKVGMANASIKEEDIDAEVDRVKNEIEEISNSVESNTKEEVEKTKVKSKKKEKKNETDEEGENDSEKEETDGEEVEDSGKKKIKKGKNIKSEEPDEGFGETDEGGEEGVEDGGIRLEDFGEDSEETSEEEGEIDTEDSEDETAEESTGSETPEEGGEDNQDENPEGENTEESEENPEGEGADSESAEEDIEGQTEESTGAVGASTRTEDNGKVITDDNLSGRIIGIISNGFLEMSKKIEECLNDKNNPIEKMLKVKVSTSKVFGISPKCISIIDKLCAKHSKRGFSLVSVLKYLSSKTGEKTFEEKSVIEQVKKNGFSYKNGMFLVNK